MSNMIEDDEVDLIELFATLWENKWDIIKITSAAAIMAIIGALAQPNIYVASALLAPAGQDNSSGLSRLSSQFGGLASLAGISLPDGGSDRTGLALQVLKSRKFASEFIKRRDIKPALMAADYWDGETGELVLDDDLYDVKKKTWDEEPTEHEVYEAYTNALQVTEDAKIGFVTIGFRHLSPKVAQQWTSWAVADLNDAIRAQDISEAQSSIDYLQRQIQATPLAELKQAFFELIQAQTETMMLAQVRAEYVFKTVDPAIVPEEKSEPKRAIIVVLATMLGGFAAVTFVLIRHYLRNQRTST